MFSPSMITSHRGDSPGVEQVDRGEWRAPVDAEVAGKVVARAGRDDRERAVRLGRDARQRRDRAVASARQHAVAARERGTSGARAVISVGGHVERDVSRREHGAQVGKQSPRPPPPRRGVHDRGPSHGGGS
jgi:hypothetical protein